MNYSESLESGVLVIELQISNDEYLLWQISPDEENNADVYFEFNDQLNGGYNNIKEVCLMRDGIHMVMADDRLEHFYFDKKFNDYTRLVSGLKKVYRNNRSILEVIDS
jgi:hypothetical protein